jgi:hypothetical protein
MQPVSDEGQVLQGCSLFCLFVPGLETFFGVRCRHTKPQKYIELEVARHFSSLEASEKAASIIKSYG